MSSLIAVVAGATFDLEALNREPTPAEASFFNLLSLAADDSQSWYGVDGGRLAGNWDLFTAGEARRIRQREQEAVFGAAIAGYDPDREPKPGDDLPARIPPVVPAAATRSVEPADSNLPPDERRTAGPAQSIDETISEKSIVSKIKLDVLGRLPNGGIKIFSLYHKKTSVIKNIGRMTYEDLLQIAGPPAREHVIKSNENDVPGVFPFSAVRESIAILAGYRTISDQTELGVGCWEGIEKSTPDELSIVLVGVGEAAYWNGDRKLHHIDYPRAKGHLLDFESGGEQWYDYGSLSSMLDSITQEEAIRVKDECVALFDRWKWKSPSSPLVATGLVFASFVQTLWEWRPQVAVMGESNSGKSYLWMTMERLFGKICIKQAKPTEPGLRQSIANTAKVVFIDEFDKCGKHRSAILEMMRLASRGEKTFRGTPGQKAIVTSVKNLIWVAGIEAGLIEEADKNRFITLDLVKPPASESGNLVLPTVAEAAALGQKMLAVAIKSIERAKPLAIKLRDTHVAGIDARIVESYAVPAAMLAVIDGASDDEAREILRLMLTDLDRQEVEVDTDKAVVLRDIFGSYIQSGNVRLTAAQWIHTVLRHENRREEAEIALAGHGLKIDTYTVEETKRIHANSGIRFNSGDKCLVVGHRKVQSGLLRNTSWDGKSIDKIMTRIPGVIRGRRHVGGLKLHCVLVPMDYLQSEILGDAEPPPDSGF